MTRDEQLIKAALDMAAETCEKSAYAADADGHHFAYSIRAIDPADVLEKVGDQRCAKCGHPRSNHPYRHPFVGMGKDPSATHPAPDAVARLVDSETPRAWLDVVDERVRQMSVEGWTPEHDDAYQSRDLAAAAACYAMIAGAHQREVFSAPPIGWPWAKSWWKPTDPRRDLVKAGALILAEIERLDRAACKGVRDE